MIQLLPDWEHTGYNICTFSCMFECSAQRHNLSKNHLHTQPQTYLIYTYYHSLMLGYTHTKTLNLYASWSYLSYLEGTSNAAAFQLNSFSRVFEPSNTQHRKSTSLSSCAWFKTQELKSY